MIDSIEDYARKWAKQEDQVDTLSEWWEPLKMDTTAASFDFKKVMKIPENQLRIVIVGKTGQGKSSTLNSIYGQPRFLSKRQGKAVTQQCQVETIDKGDYCLVLVDTPGLFDPETSKEETQREIKKCIDLTLPGPHIVLYAIRMDGRISTEDKETFKAFIHQFGSAIRQHMVIILTYYDSLQDSEDRLNEFISHLQKTIPILKDHNTFMPFNNNLKGTEAEEQLDKLLKIILDTYKKNNASCYTNEQYLARAKEICEEKQNEEKRKLQEKENEIQLAKMEERRKWAKIMEEKERQSIINALKIGADLVVPGFGLIIEGAHMFYNMANHDVDGVKDNVAGLAIGGVFFCAGHFLSKSTKEAARKTVKITTANAAASTVATTSKELVKSGSTEVVKQTSKSAIQTTFSVVARESLKQTSTKLVLPKILNVAGDLSVAQLKNYQTNALLQKYQKE